MKRTLIILLFFIPFPGWTQTLKPYSKDVEAVLKKSGRNRPELETAINYFKKIGDPLKLQAIEFLVSNMDIHYSADYYWVDSAGRRLSFNEKDYTDFNLALKAFDEEKMKNPGLHPQAFTYRDIDTIKADYLIDNVERAFEYWKRPKLKSLSFKDFCEYILPYRVSVEPLQNWRKIYLDKFSWLNDSAKGKPVEELLYYLASDQKKWFTNTWEIEQRKEPLPRLGALQLLARSKGNCEDIAGLEVFVLRSQGFPAAVDMVPFWATSSGTHFFNNTFDEQLKPIPFDVSTEGVKINNFSREPSKVVRDTYSKQATALASFFAEKNIPEGFMRRSNYIDVTKDHWETKDLICKIKSNAQTPPIAFAYVFNGGTWKPTWWGKVLNGTVTFTGMCKGAVFLPAYYMNGKLIPAGYPVASGYKTETVLKPDTVNKRTVTIAWQDKYLIYRPGKQYKLYFWDNGWNLCGQKTGGENTTELVFDQVPDNALMLLMPEYSQGKERPFTISKEGIREWW